MLGQVHQPPNLKHGAQGYLVWISPQIIRVKIYVVFTIYSLFSNTTIFISMSVRNLPISKDRKPQRKLSQSHDWKSSRARQTLKRVLRATGAHNSQPVSPYSDFMLRVVARWLHHSCLSWPQGLITKWMLRRPIAHTDWLWPWEPTGDLGPLLGKN